jgi:hypothetical protein
VTGLHVQPAAEAGQTAALTGLGGGLDVKRYCSSSKARSLRFLLEHEGAQLFFDLAESPIG